MNRSSVKKTAARLKKLLSDAPPADEFSIFCTATAVRFMEASGFFPEGIESYGEKCNFLRSAMPDVFEEFKTDERLVDAVREVLSETDDRDFQNPETIGWLYQYYNGEGKDEVRKSIKIEKDEIPSATQVFTPLWVVKYLVENSLGAMFGKKSDRWGFYLGGKPQKTPDVREVRLIDPCMGCGNILLYAFDVFMDIYKAFGFVESEAAVLILENNLYGFDIDDRACRLAVFALLMKARHFCDDILSVKTELNLCAAREDNGIFKNAAQFGSLIRVDKIPDGCRHIKQAYILSQKYDVVVTNPPYMGRKSLNSALKDFIDTNYPQGKSELYSAFILSCIGMLKQGGICAMVTIHSWMFISSFEELRKYILGNVSILSMVHAGAATFEGLNAFNALAAAFCIKKEAPGGNKSVFIRLADYYRTREKLLNFHNPKNRYDICQSEFYGMPKHAFIYWLSDKARRVFSQSMPLKAYCAPRQGLATGDNKSFLRYWYEVPREQIGFGYNSVEDFHASGKLYAPYNKGGDYRKWYGNNELVIRFDRESFDALSKQGNNLPSKRYYFKEGITWSLFGFENFGVRYKPDGFVFDVSGSSMFPEFDGKYILAFLASNVAFFYLSAIAPTVNFQVGDIAGLPLIIDKSKARRIERLAQENIEISKADWDSFETSWDFSEHPLINGKGLISDCFERWRTVAEERYKRLKENEEEINSLFIAIYGLEGELLPTVADRDIAIRRADLKREITSLISYAIGCMLRRREGKIPINDELLRELAEFIKNSFGEGYAEQNLEYIASVLSRKSGATPLDVIKNYVLKDFYRNHFKVYKKHPIYRISEKSGVKTIEYNV